MRVLAIPSIGRGSEKRCALDCVGTAGDLYIPYFRTGQTVAAAAQISTWTGSGLSRTRPMWFSRMIIRVGHFGWLLTAALGVRCR